MTPEEIFAPANNQDREENKQQETIVAEDTSNARINELHPETEQTVIEETPVQEKATESIPNMYIKADTETVDVPSDVAIFSQDKKEDAG